MLENVLFLINPTANENRSMQAWEAARKKYSFLPAQPINVLTLSDMTAYIQERNPDVVVISGGDGTINKVCTAILPLNKKPKLAIFGMGFGNALAFSLGVETTEKAMHVLLQRPHEVTIDLFKTNLPSYPIGTFNISVGFDARTVYHRMNDRYIGVRSYILSGIKSFFLHSNKPMVFTINHSVTMHALSSSLVIANTPVIGKNFVIAEGARMNDNLLDCTIFSTKYAYFSNLRLHGFKHPLYSTKGKVQFKATHIRVEGEPFVQVDGDPAILKEPLEVAVLPSQITFLANSQEHLQYTPFVKK